MGQGPGCIHAFVLTRMLLAGGARARGRSPSRTPPMPAGAAPALSWPRSARLPAPPAARERWARERRRPSEGEGEGGEEA